MTDRAAIVATITDVIEQFTAIPPGSLPADKALRHVADSMDQIEISIAIEDEFFADGGATTIDIEPDWTVDKIADLVIAKLAAKEVATN